MGPVEGREEIPVTTPPSSAWRAFWLGLGDMRRTLPPASVLYLATLVASTLALGPASAGLHEAFDAEPAAAAFLGGGGLDLLEEVGRGMGALFFISSLRSVGLWVLLFVPVALLLLAGTYACAARPRDPLLGTFVRGGLDHAPHFAAVVLLNGLTALACAAVAGLAIAGLHALLDDPVDPGPGWTLALISGPLVLFFATLVRISVGFGQAARVLDGHAGPWRSFRTGLTFSVRRFLPVNALTWATNGLRLAILYLALFAYRPGYATEGAAWVSALQLQAGFFLLAYLRAAEIRMQVEYLRGRMPVRPAVPILRSPSEPSAEVAPEEAEPAVSEVDEVGPPEEPPSGAAPEAPPRPEKRGTGQDCWEEEPPPSCEPAPPPPDPSPSGRPPGSAIGMTAARIQPEVNG